MTFIGGIEGNSTKYFKILREQNPTYSLSLGDVGGKKIYDEILDYGVDILRHQTIMGDYDFYPYWYTAFVLGDYGVFDLEGHVIGFLRGAATINPHSMYGVQASSWVDRTERSKEWENYNNLCFPEDEQLTKKDFTSAVEGFRHRKPNVIATHDCPQEVCEKMFGISELSDTRVGLQSVWENSQPDIWVFSHHRKSKTMTMNGTKFVCLNNCETLTL